MRQLLVQVPRGCGQTVLEIAQRHGGVNLATFEGQGRDATLDITLIHVSNNRMERLIEDLEVLPDLHITLIPRGVIALQPPAGEAPEEVTDVGARSPIEILLAGLQSIGSWKGFLGYAAAAGVVVWIGLYTDTIYLLTASMLIAPFAGPAMNTAIATARGDWRLMRRTLARYFAALAVTITTTVLLSLIFQQNIATPLMVATSQVSSVAVLLPLVAGAAGALNLVQSERSSLVSGAAIGMLVAASLAPPAGTIGMAGVVGEWNMALSGIFVLLLQLVGINMSGALVFRLYGVSAEGVRFSRGKAWVYPTTIAVTITLLVGLLTLQLWNRPDLQRSSRSQRAASEIQRVVNESGMAQLVETNVRFTRADIEGQNTLLGVVYVQRGDDTNLSADDIRTQLADTIQRHLLEQEFNVTPLIDVNVLEAPAQVGND